MRNSLPIKGDPATLMRPKKLSGSRGITLKVKLNAFEHECLKAAAAADRYSELAPWARDWLVSVAAPGAKRGR